MKKAITIISALFFTYSNPSFANFSDINYEKCNLKESSYDKILNQVKKGNKKTLSSISGCLKYNHRLIFQALLIDPSQLKYTAPIFRDSENFVLRLMKVHPEILQFASDRLRKDRIFIKRTTYIYRDALKYAHPELLDNKIFMRKMIKIDSRNYIFASSRIKKMPEYAKLAFKDNGKLLIYAPQEIISNKDVVKTALKSNLEAYNFIDEDLKKDKEIKKLAKKRKDNFSKEKLESYLKKHYLTEDKNDNTGTEINEEKRIFKNNFLVDKKYITKWHRSIKLENMHLKEKWRLIEASNRNHNSPWQEDLKQYPELTKKIERFFYKRYIDKKTVDGLSLTYLVKIREKPTTLAFNLYLIGPSNDIELGEKYITITSFTAIAVKSKNGWRLSVIETILDRETKTGIAYKHGHKKYILQDLYLENENDKYPKLIFRVEDEFAKYFEIYGPNIGDKYHLIYRLNPLKSEEATYSKDDPFKIIRTREEQEAYEWEQMMENCRNKPECAKKIK